MARSCRWFLIVFTLIFLLSTANAGVTHTVYWNTSNPLFAGGEYEISVRLGDSIVIVCPQLRSRMEEGEDEAYMVINKDSEMAHMNCQLEGAQPMVACSRPYEETAVTSRKQIRSIRPNEFSVGFEPGQTHYLLSTSGGRREQLQQRMGGVCRHHWMRMRIHVEEAERIVETTTTRAARLQPKATTAAAAAAADPFWTQLGNQLQQQPLQHPHRSKHLRGAFSQSDMPGMFKYDVEHDPDQRPASNWDSAPVSADELSGDIRGGYDGRPIGENHQFDFIISEHSSTASFSLIILSVLILLR